MRRSPGVRGTGLWRNPRGADVVATRDHRAGRRLCRQTDRPGVMPAASAARDYISDGASPRVTERVIAANTDDAYSHGPRDPSCRARRWRQS